MTENDWLDACADQPDDDLTRLAFADWLADQGNADRAEFIRLQVALSRQTLKDPTQRQRAGELLKQHEEAWLGPLVGLAPPVEPIREASPSLVGRLTKRLVSLFSRRKSPSENGFVARPLRLTGVNWERGLPEGLSPATDAPLVAGFVASPHLARLTRLDLRNHGIGDVGASAVAVSSHLARLTTLILGRNGIGDAGARALAASPHLVRLTELDLSFNQIGAVGTGALAASPLLARLTHLRLDGNYPMGDAGASALAASSHLARLTTLHLGGNEIGDAGARALAASPHLAGLTDLNLIWNRIGAAGARALADSSYLARLASLDVGYNLIDTGGAEVLRQAFGQRVRVVSREDYDVDGH